MNLSRFLGSAVKLRLDRFMEYDLASLQFEGILIETGWGQWYGEPRKYYGRSRPSIPLSLADKFMDRDLKFFGCDLPGVDKSGAAEKIIHSMFLARDVVIYENLTNLEKLPEATPFTFVGLPLNLQGIDGSPVRAVAILGGQGF